MRAIHPCGGEYRLTMASGAHHRFPEINLRFKTDASREPSPGGRTDESRGRVAPTLVSRFPRTG